MAGFILKRNDISPRITRLIRAVQPPQRRKVLRAMGTTFMSITQGNFNQVGSSYRPTPWPAKKDGTPATLKKRGVLSNAFHLAVDDSFAVVSNPTKYAAIHQFGGKTAAHKIVAKNKKSLAFAGRGGGTVFVKSVNHPGSNIPARPFFPVLSGRLTAPAEKLIMAAAYRVLKAEGAP